MLSFLGAALGVAVATLIGRTYGDFMARATFDRHQAAGAPSRLPATGTPEVASTDFVSFVPIANSRLNMQLPKELSRLIEEKDSGGDIELLEKYTGVWTTRSCLIKHFVFKAPLTVSPEQAADRTEADLKVNSAYRATRRTFDVSGIDGLILDAQYEAMGQNVEQSILYFSKGSEMWEVHVFGISDPYPASLHRMKDRVFGSIRVKA